MFVLPLFVDTLFPGSAGRHSSSSMDISFESVGSSDMILQPKPYHTINKLDGSELTCLLSSRTKLTALLIEWTERKSKT